MRDIVIGISLPDLVNVLILKNESCQLTVGNDLFSSLNVTQSRLKLRIVFNVARYQLPFFLTRGNSSVLIGLGGTACSHPIKPHPPQEEQVEVDVESACLMLIHLLKHDICTDQHLETILFKKVMLILHPDSIESLI